MTDQDKDYEKYQVYKKNSSRGSFLAYDEAIRWNRRTFRKG